MHLLLIQEMHLLLIRDSQDKLQLIAEDVATSKTIEVLLVVEGVSYQEEEAEETSFKYST